MHCIILDEGSRDSVMRLRSSSQNGSKSQSTISVSLDSNKRNFINKTNGRENNGKVITIDIPTSRQKERQTFGWYAVVRHGVNHFVNDFFITLTIC